MPHYTDEDAVAAELGVTFTDAQYDQCGELIVQAERTILRTTGRTWTNNPAQTAAETQLAYGGTVTLRYLPVVSITSILVQPNLYCARVLLAARSYALEDAAAGIVRLRGYADYHATINYVYDSTIPADLARATTLLVADWMRPAISGVDADVASYSVGGELTVTRFARSAQDRATLPAEVERILQDLGGAAGWFQ